MNDPRPPTDFRSVFAPRRARLAAALAPGIAVVPTAPERLRNRDAHYPYRYDSYFYYLSGFPEPEAVLVQIAGKAPKSFCGSACSPVTHARSSWFMAWHRTPCSGVVSPSSSTAAVTRWPAST